MCQHCGRPVDRDMIDALKTELGGANGTPGFGQLFAMAAAAFSDQGASSSLPDTAAETDGFAFRQASAPQDAITGWVGTFLKDGPTSAPAQSGGFADADDSNGYAELPYFDEWVL